LSLAAERSQQPPLPLETQVAAFADIAALFDIAQRLDLVQYSIPSSPPRRQGLRRAVLAAGRHQSRRFSHR